MTETAQMGYRAPRPLRSSVIAPMPPAQPRVICRPKLTVLTLVVTDLLAVMATFVLSTWIGNEISPLQAQHYPWRLLPVAALFPLAFAGAELYKGPSLAEEMRGVFFRSTTIWVGVIALTFFQGEAETISRRIVGLAWGLTIFGVPLARVVVRRMFAGRSWWGSPVLVLGTRDAIGDVIRNLRAYPSRCVKPVGVLLCDEGEDNAEVEGVPVLGSCSDVDRYPSRFNLNRAIVALQGLDRARQAHLIESARIFKQLTVIPDIEFGSMWVAARDYGGMLGLHVKPELFRLWSRFCKRFWDIVLSSIGMVLLTPVFVVIALLIKLTSPGPVFFSQGRLGRGGHFFRMWKFRSMVVDADERLEEYLASYPRARAEWDADQKLRDDPRITWIGRLLRRSSLDELPQLFNVLNGTMSLVGPRPVPDDGIEKFEQYGPLYNDYYKAVRPGMSGLWQVSGRSDLSYDDRVKLDMRYIRNWSVWYDWEILLKTARVVLTGKGAV